MVLFTFKTPTQGAQTSIYCAVSEEMEEVSGQYLVTDTSGLYLALIYVPVEGAKYISSFPPC